MARMLALALAIGGCGWGLLLSPWLFRSDVSPLAVAVFGPGYVVTLGYIVRAITTPRPTVRVFIWSSSLLVQGGWLSYVTWGIVSAGELAAKDFANGMTAWWAFATVVSAAGLFLDLPRSEATE